MTPDLAAVAAAVDASFTAGTLAAAERLARCQLPHLVRARVRWTCGRHFADVLGSRCDLPTQAGRGDAGASTPTDEPARAAVLRSAFRDLGWLSDASALFVPVGREFLAGDLPVPRRADRLVVEVDGGLACDPVVRDGLLRVKALGCRVALAGFTGSTAERRLLPLADFVKIDSRDLALEGRPLLDLAVSRGAELVAEFVDTDCALGEARAAGFRLVQGRALDRPGPLSHPSPITSRLKG